MPILLFFLVDLLTMCFLITFENFALLRGILFAPRAPVGHGTSGARKCKSKVRRHIVGGTLDESQTLSGRIEEVAESSIRSAGLVGLVLQTKRSLERVRNVSGCRRLSLTEPVMETKPNRQ